MSPLCQVQVRAAVARAMPPQIAVLYELEGTIHDGTDDVLYYGLTGLLPGQTPDQAIFRRDQYHKLYPKACIADVEDYSMRVLSIAKYEDALVDEAPQLA